ncbi:Plug domain-containing protein [bacterium]|nr:Plug domain-containing protein [bacterium]
MANPGEARSISARTWCLDDFGNQFIVRDGGPDQNLILLDGVEIFNPYRNSGMPSLINLAIVGDVSSMLADILPFLAIGFLRF